MANQNGSSRDEPFLCMIYLIILSIILVILYMSITFYLLKGVPDSVSAMVYAMPDKYLWSIWLWLVTGLLLPSLLETLPSTWQFLGFLFVACALFCGAIPLLKNEPNTEHNIFGVSAGIFSQFCVAVISPWWLLSWLGMSLAVIWKSKATLIAEGICYTSLVGCLLNH